MTIEPTRMLRGANVLRIVWVPGTDRLRGVCHCGAAYEAGDPAAVWEWLLAHPVGQDHAPVADAPLPRPHAEPLERFDTARHPAPA
ncbi:hypothetical protein [Rhodococcus wratislaviensis]|uniref:hypothetical protein n=1 Tax=Rhodococcus wratislaviensis TaxID=44752 RepID=UPI003665647F